VGRSGDEPDSKGGTRMKSGLLAASRCEMISGLTGDELLTEEGVEDNADEAQDERTVEASDRLGEVKSARKGVVVRLGHCASDADLAAVDDSNESCPLECGKCRSDGACGTEAVSEKVEVELWKLDGEVSDCTAASAKSG